MKVEERFQKVPTLELKYDGRVSEKPCYTEKTAPSRSRLYVRQAVKL